MSVSLLTFLQNKESLFVKYIVISKTSIKIQIIRDKLFFAIRVVDQLTTIFQPKIPPLEAQAPNHALFSLRNTPNVQDDP